MFEASLRDFADYHAHLDAFARLDWRHLSSAKRRSFVCRRFLRTIDRDQAVWVPCRDGRRRVECADDRLGSCRGRLCAAPLRDAELAAPRHDAPHARIARPSRSSSPFIARPSPTSISSSAWSIADHIGWPCSTTTANSASPRARSPGCSPIFKPIPQTWRAARPMVADSTTMRSLGQLSAERVTEIITPPRRARRQFRKEYRFRAGRGQRGRER